MRNLSHDVRYPAQNPEYDEEILSSTGITHSGKF